MISNFFLYPTVLKEELTAERRSVLAMEDLIVECHTKGGQVTSNERLW